MVCGLPVLIMFLSPFLIFDLIFNLGYGYPVWLAIMCATMIIASYIVYSLVKKGISIPAIIAAIGSIILAIYLLPLYINLIL